MRSASVTITVRNMAGAFYPGNPYRNLRTQEAGQDAVLATGAHFLLLQEATGVGKPFCLPKGWQLSPASALDRGSGSVVAAAGGVGADVTWRPRHPLLDAFGAYLDFGLMQFDGEDVVIASVHAGGWQDNTWAATGAAAPCAPTSAGRPRPPTRTTTCSSRPISQQGSAQSTSGTSLAQQSATTQGLRSH